MLNNSRSRTILLIAGVAIIALAAALFIAAATIRDFAPSGQAFLSGNSNVLLVLVFVLLAGLSAMLLIVIARTPRSTGEISASEETRPSRVAEETAIEQAVAPNKTAAAEPGSSPEIISETVGELRTSVEVMQEELEEILEEEVPADKEHMESLYQETDRLRKIIDGMEQMAQAQTLARSLKKEPVQIEPLLKDIIEKTRLAVPDGEIAYSIECDSALIMTGDPECISLIIGNIADNAAKAVKGTGSVVLAAAHRGEWIVFSVRDTGTGIRRARLSHIYERFFRGTGSGVGMGLAVVKELVDACGGKIEVETAVGKGTTFIVSIPSS